MEGHFLRFLPEEPGSQCLFVCLHCHLLDPHPISEDPCVGVGGANVDLSFALTCRALVLGCEQQEEAGGEVIALLSDVGRRRTCKSV